MAVALTALNSPIGVKLPTGVILSPGTEVFYVHNTPSIFRADLAAETNTSILSALNQRDAARPGAVLVLEGHAESITAATAWSKANTKIIFLGEGDDRGLVTFTAAASAITVGAANTRIINGRFQLEPTTGTVNVAAPFTFNSAGCAMTDNWFGAGTTANAKITIGITTTAGATRFAFERNTVRGAPLATMTTFLRLVGVESPRVVGNDIICGTTAAAVGPVQMLTTLSSNVVIAGNVIQNNAASSTACITGMANATGWVYDNYLRNMTDTSNAQIALTAAIWPEFSNLGVNNVGERGIALGTASV